MKTNLRSTAFILSVLLTNALVHAQVPSANDRQFWKIQNDGSIYWAIDQQLPHSDHIEMSGEQASIWIQYSVDTARNFSITRTVVFPTFRTQPNDTHASAMYTFTDQDLPRFFINKQPLKPSIINGRSFAGYAQKAVGVQHRGIMHLYSHIEKPSVHIKRSIFPSTDKALAIEKFVFINSSDKAISVEMEAMQKVIEVDTTRSYKTSFSFVVRTEGSRFQQLQPGDSIAFAVSYQALRQHATIQAVNVQEEEDNRSARIHLLLNQLQLHTPDTILNTAFAFAKIRATESIFKTKGGYMHGPGGLAYYAAIWANDQAEYINPFFGFLNDRIAHASVMNSYYWFSKYMNADFKPIPSSIIAEGDSYWNGAGDRGDQAMIAYGAARYALTCGRADSARKLWPLIQWCLEFLEKKKTSEGIYASDSDELEGRFPAGKANLSTNALAYGALISASHLAAALSDPANQKRYSERATQLKKDIENYFGATVQGFNTYRYYDGNDKLRSWICLPLVMNILDRKEETMQALFSPHLWTNNGILTEAGSTTFWDRSTLYAFRGLFTAGAVDKAMPYFQSYSKRRLLGDHVPYPVEAWPEGNQRHLSAESGLYCRTIIEGLFGIEPTGFRSFTLAPRLPKNWNTMEITNMTVFQSELAIKVQRTGKKVRVTVTKSGKEVFKKDWDENGRLFVTL